MQDFRTVAVAAAQQAGKIIAGACGADYRVDYKEGAITNMVTDVDRRSERADRKSTRLNSSHGYISYAVFCLKKKKDKWSLLSPARIRLLFVTTAPDQAVDECMLPQ